MKLLVLLLVPCLSLSELSPGFTKCRKFFLKNEPPQYTVPASIKVIPVKEICQCLRDEKDLNYFYATLYNTDWRIPIYSAYRFYRSKSDGRKDYWYTEPQLDGYAEACMAKGGKNLNNQAVNDDYIGSMECGYHKGHLYPVQHTYDALSMEATSTLTNAAPQDSGFNMGKWRVHEGKVIDDLGSCKEAYVVTGVVSDHTIPKLNNRVTVSKYYWRATCCEKEKDGKGYIGPVGTDKIVTPLSITDLQTWLTTEYRVSNIVIFPGDPTGGCN